MRVAVVCLGNELVGDDGVGIRVGRVLQRLALPSHVEVLIRPNVGLELVELLDAYDSVILVDAMTSGLPGGSCVRLDPREAASMATHPSCSHSLGVAEILQLVARMFPERSETAVRIVGIEAVSIDGFGVGLSAEVESAMPTAVDMVLELLESSEDTRLEGRAEAALEAARTLTVQDVLGG